MNIKSNPNLIIKLNPNTRTFGSLAKLSLFKYFFYRNGCCSFKILEVPTVSVYCMVSIATQPPCNILLNYFLLDSNIFQYKFGVKVLIKFQDIAYEYESCHNFQLACTQL